MRGARESREWNKAPNSKLRASIKQTAIDFVHGYFAAGEVFVGGKIEGAGCALVGDSGWPVRRIGVVGDEFDFVFSFLGVEDHHGMVNRKLREANDVDNQRQVLREMSKELIGHSLLF
jgi:hypothetical protein